ncbi:MAG: hypothetical protein C0395_02590 [Gemmatimonas sp.]|nr:hypothetical protein [Gemmatimonas sp.]
MFVAGWLGVAAAAEPEPTTCDLDFGVTGWRIEAPVGEALGTAAWVRCPDGAWRLDLARTEPGDPETGTAAAVLGRLGEGWTAVAPGDGSVVLQAWDGPLRTLEPAQAERLAALLALATAGSDPVRAAVAPAVWRERPAGAVGAGRTPWEVRASRAAPRLLVWPPDDGGGSPLARDLAQRGLGRGGAGESWRVDIAPDGGVRLESRRHAATLALEPPRLDSRRGDPFDVLLPLWPLGEVLDESAGR